MGWKSTIEPFVTRFPSVKKPKGHLPLKIKVMWSLAVLAIYFFLTNILLFGLASGGGGTDVFGQFRSILAGSQGSLLQLGIGPIVTGSIVLQLLTGGDVINFDTNDPRDQAIYQGLQKWLVVAMVVLTGLPMTFSSFLPASTAVADSLGVSILAVKVLMFAQVFVGGIIILYLDEIVSKWGVGSGVGLFIIAGISQRLFGGVVSQVIPGWIALARNGFGGGISQAVYTLLFGQGYLIAILTTALIFAVVVYAESTRIEIPLSHSKVKGGRGRYPIKLIYASVLPLILVRAVQANIQFVGRILSSQLGDAGMPDWLGVYAQSQPVGGLFYYFSPIQRPQDWMWWLSGTAASQEVWQVILRLAIDFGFMVVGGAIFAVFWVDTTGMGPESVAKQIHQGDMQIPGFRQSPRIIEKVVGRYIPTVTILGGALIGFLAIFANMLGTIGGVSGTGILLSVSITYKIYEEFAEELIMEKYPVLSKMF